MKRNIKSLLVLINIRFLRCPSDLPVVCDATSELRSSLTNKINTSPLPALPLPRSPLSGGMPVKHALEKNEDEDAWVFITVTRSQLCGFGDHISKLIDLLLVV